MEPPLRRPASTPTAPTGRGTTNARQAESRPAPAPAPAARPAQAARTQQPARIQTEFAPGRPGARVRQPEPGPGPERFRPDPGPTPPETPGPPPPEVPETDFERPSYTPFTPPPAAFSALQIMENLLFSALGIKGLGAWAADLYNRGASPTEIVAALRYGTDTSDAGKAAYKSYLEAFPKMDEFLKNGIFTGENPEMQYIEYRNTIREAGSRYNVNDSLLTNTKIADYIGGRNSAAEIVNRMNMAAVAIASTPPDTISVLRDYYNLSSSDLMSFYLDTDATEAALQQRYAAAQIGSEALRQSIESDRAFSEELAQRGVTSSEAQQGFQKVARQREFTAGLGETATQRELSRAAFGDEQLAQKVERIGQSRVGQFQGGGGFVSGTNQASGLAASSR